MNEVVQKAALVAIGLLVSPLLAAAQELPAQFEEGVFEIVVPSLGTVTGTVLVDESQGIYLSLPLILEHIGYDVVVLRAGELLWQVSPAAPEHRLIFSPPSYSGPDTEITDFDPDAIVPYGESIFVRTDALGRLLDAQLEIDWSTLRILLTGSGPAAFPGQARALVEERRSRLATPSDTAAGPLVPYKPRTGGMIFDWSVSAFPSEGNIAGRGALGAAVLGGDLVLGASSSSQAGAVGDYSYRRIIPESDRINQLHLGQVLTQDLAPRSIVGVVVSNIPQQRDVLFTDVPVAPDLPEGWEFEVYQAGQLIGFSTAGSDQTVSVPVRYGQTPLEVRMISPAGEEVTLPYRHILPLTHLPPGRTEYSAGGGICPGGSCDGIAYGEVRHGFGRHLTFGGGIQAVSELGVFQVRPSVLAIFLPDRHWALDLEARASEFVRASVDRVSDTGEHVRVAASLHEPAFGQPSFLPGAGARWQLQSRVDLRPLHFTARMDGITGEGLQRVRVGVGNALPRGYGEVAIEHRSFGADALVGRATTILPERLWLFDRPVGLSGSFRAIRDGLRLLELSTSARPTSDSYLSTALQWNADQGELYASLTFRQIFRGARADLSAARRSRNSTFAMAARGSVALSTDSRVEFTDRNLQGRAGVLGRVYYDRNGNQTFDGSDEPAADVSVLVGGVRARTDSTGYYSAWNVTPYEITTVAVDTLSGIDPRYTVLAGGTRVRPVPHFPNEVDFPLAETREILGRVVRENGRGAGGVAIELTHPQSGRQQTVRTFSDGTFYVSRILPGDWVIRVSPASLQALRTTTRPLELRVRIDLSDPNPLMEVEPFILLEPEQPPDR